MGNSVSDRLKLLVIGDRAEGAPAEAERFAFDVLKDRCEFIRPGTLGDGLSQLQSGINGVICYGSESALSNVLLEQSGLLEQVPDGFALLDLDMNVLWTNSAFATLVTSLNANESGVYVTIPPRESFVGRPIPEVLGQHQFLGPNFSPLQTALGLGETVGGNIRLGDKGVCELLATPIFEAGLGDESWRRYESLDDTSFHDSKWQDSDPSIPIPGVPTYLFISLRDITSDIQQREKFNAIYKAGQDLGDLQPQDVREMSSEERVELLTSRILHYTADVLQYETVEVRLLDDETGELKPLLADGMKPDAECRRLYASETGHGVTGFVAATGRSYLCEDTSSDQLYLSGAEGARSSLTVPLVLHEEILGTINVESPDPHAFHENDLQFLELFGREVAIALNTLDLLDAEKAHTVGQSTQKILCEVAGPIDDILQDTARILEKFVADDQPAADALLRILEKARNIKHLVRQTLEPAGEASDNCEQPPTPGNVIRNKRILVVDEEADVRRSAHELLGRYGAVVETAKDGEEALLLARTSHYDAAMVTIKPPDMPGSKLYRSLRETREHMPVLLMTGYGYDPSHTIVKARQMGLKSVLFKPFRTEQLLKDVGEAVSGPFPTLDECECA